MVLFILWGRELCGVVFFVCCLGFDCPVFLLHFGVLFFFWCFVFLGVSLRFFLVFRWLFSLLGLLEVKQTQDL